MLTQPIRVIQRRNGLDMIGGEGTRRLIQKTDPELGSNGNRTLDLIGTLEKNPESIVPLNYSARTKCTGRYAI